MHPLEQLSNNIAAGTATLPEACEVLEQIQSSDFSNFVRELSNLAAQQASISDDMWSVLLGAIAHRRQPADEMQMKDEADSLRRLYSLMGSGPDGKAKERRYHLLTRLARNGSTECLGAFSDLMVDDAPQGIVGISSPFLPLFTATQQLDANSLFPRLLDGLANPDLAAAVLDLGNFLMRKNLVSQHPATSRIDPLLKLAEAVVANLSQIQATPLSSPEELKNRQTQVANSLPLAVSLCDALGLIGDDRAISSLSRLAELKHRRLRVEAAAAMVRLEQSAPAKTDVQPLAAASETETLPKGSQIIAEMAAEPVVRLRAVAYAEELGIAEHIPLEHRSPVAMAEAELTAYLAEPMQMGMPPASCNLIDSRTLYWPGYEEPRNCYLFQFEYEVARGGDGEPLSTTPYSSVGIAGPLVHAFHTDLADLPPESIYAAFAGYQAEHEDIREIDLGSGLLRSSQQDQVDDMAIQMAKDGFEDIKPKILAYFFDQPVLVAEAKQDSARGVVIMDENQFTQWQSIGNLARPIGPVEAYYIYKGRRLLRNFNSDQFE